MKKLKVGKAFGDHVYTERKFFFNPFEKGMEERRTNMRSYVLPICLVLAILVLLGKLFYLQVWKGAYYRSLSDTNRFRTTIVHAPRGIIYDRNGTPLVYNTPGYRETIDGKTRVLSQEEAIGLLAKGDKHLEIDSLRNYPQKELLGHILGYVGEISGEELKESQFVSYHTGDLIGQMGIEAEYENKLKGTDGKTLVEVDALGKTIRQLGQTDPVPGENVTLTIDANLQKRVYDAMNSVKKGAAIVSKPDGEVLAMVSKPSFNPNLFTLGKHYISDGEYKTVSDLLTDTTNQPLLNRAISGTYPPGSTFKIVAASAALEDKIIDDHFTIEDTGVVKLGTFSFANWYYTQYGKTEGTVDVVKAIQRSNDIFFYKVGGLLGVDRLSAFARQFGLGKQLGIDLPGEAKGLVPTKEWKKKVIGDNWYTGDDYQYGIGQGFILTTPLQVNMWTQAIGDGGELYEPHLLQGERGKRKGESLLSEKNFELIRTGMIKACSPGGVAWPLFEFKIKNSKLKIDNKDYSPVASASADYRQVTIACKTGTAQQGGEKSLPHAWITLFAPAYHPQIVVTVLSEESGEGSNVAGPIARDTLTAWFER